MATKAPKAGGSGRLDEKADEARRTQAILGTSTKTKLTPTQKHRITEFNQLVGAPVRETEKAFLYLHDADWDVEKAVNSYFENQQKTANGVDSWTIVGEKKQEPQSKPVTTQRGRGRGRASDSPKREDYKHNNQKRNGTGGSRRGKGYYGDGAGRGRGGSANGYPQKHHNQAGSNNSATANGPLQNSDGNSVENVQPQTNTVNSADSADNSQITTQEKPRNGNNKGTANGPTYAQQASQGQRKNETDSSPNRGRQGPPKKQGAPQGNLQTKHSDISANGPQQKGAVVKSTPSRTLTASTSAVKGPSPGKQEEIKADHAPQTNVSSTENPPQKIDSSSTASHSTKVAAPVILPSSNGSNSSLSLEMFGSFGILDNNLESAKSQHHQTQHAQQHAPQPQSHHHLQQPQSQQQQPHSAPSQQTSSQTGQHQLLQQVGGARNQENEDVSAALSSIVQQSHNPPKSQPKDVTSVNPTQQQSLSNPQDGASQLNAGFGYIPPFRANPNMLFENGGDPSAMGAPGQRPPMHAPGTFYEGTPAYQAPHPGFDSQQHHTGKYGGANLRNNQSGSSQPFRNEQNGGTAPLKYGQLNQADSREKQDNTATTTQQGTAAAQHNLTSGQPSYLPGYAAYPIGYQPYIQQFSPYQAAPAPQQYPPHPFAPPNMRYFTTKPSGGPGYAGFPAGQTAIQPGPYEDDYSKAGYGYFVPEPGTHHAGPPSKQSATTQSANVGQTGAQSSSAGSTKSGGFSANSASAQDTNYGKQGDSTSYNKYNAGRENPSGSSFYGPSQYSPGFFQPAMVTQQPTYQQQRGSNNY